jgi:hypothetical protein
MTTQHDFAKKWDEALRECEIAKEECLDLTGAVTSRYAAVYHGQQDATPPLDLLNAATKAKSRWKAAKKRRHEIAVEWAKA